MEKDTVFVRGLERGTNSEELNEVFSEIGPVKSAFIVVEKDGPHKGESRGFGFVQFALPEDAVEAVNKLQGFTIGTNSIVLELAEKKGFKRDKGASKNPATKTHGGKLKRPDLISSLVGETVVSGRKSKDAGNAAKEKVRTAELLRDCSVVLFNVPETMTKPQLKKKMSKIGRVNLVEYPLESVDFGRENKTKSALVIYTKRSLAATAVQKLSGKEWDDGLIHCRRLKTVAATSKDRSRARLVVRNIPFNSTEQTIQDAFRKFGPMLSIKMPTDPETKKIRGFAFIQYACRVDAREAMEKLNGKKLQGPRVVAIDWALDKGEYEARKQAREGNAEENEGEEEEADDDEEDEEIKEDELEEEVESDGSDEEEKKTVKDEVPLTLFIRNILFETTQEELYTVFKAYGGVRYVKITKHDDGRSKGTGFVNFYNRASYDRALAAAAKVPAKASKIGGMGIECGGRPLFVTEALDRSGIRVMEKQTEMNKTKKDNKHLYLLREGQIFQDSEVEIPKGDLKKRERAEREKKTKLRNPLFFVSPTRLSVRNLFRGDGSDSKDSSLGVTDAELLRVFKQAAIQGMKDNVVGPNEGDPTLFPPGWGSKDFKGIAPPYVKQARVLRDEPMLMNEKEAMKRKNKAKGKSKGFGFVEFSEHVHALAALRVLNNNPEYAYVAIGGPKAMKVREEKRSRLIVEFAVENAGKIRQRQKRLEEINMKRKLAENRKKAMAYANTQGSGAKDIPKKRKKDEAQKDGSAVVRERKKQKKGNKTKGKKRKPNPEEPGKVVEVETTGPKAKKKKKKTDSEKEEAPPPQNFRKLVNSLKETMFSEKEKPKRWFEV